MSLSNQCVRECKTFMTTGQQEKDISVQLRLKAEREAAKLTQQEVADALDVALKTITRWERSTPIPSDKLSELGRLGIDAVYVLTGERIRKPCAQDAQDPPSTYAKAHSPPAVLSDREQAVLDCARQLNRENQEMLHGIVKSMLKTQKLREAMRELNGGGGENSGEG